MSARYIIGDVFDTLATLEPNSVDLVFSSPPFLALRSYLPADDPLKAKEIGSEATPADFLDTLLDVVEACDRVLAPHGSLCFELGDTYAGSGGAGGDYAENGLHEGQPVFRQSYSEAWPLPKSLSGIPTLFAWSLAYGRNLLRPERTTPRWRIRNVVVWARPNPPVGALGDKFRPATSYLTVACKSDKRWFDLDAVREPAWADTVGWPSLAQRKDSSYKRKPKEFTKQDAPERSGQNPAGAPPLDYWEIPTHGYPGSHYATWPPKLCVKPILSMCPAFVCRECGTALGSIHETPRTVLRGMRGADNGRVGEDGGRTQEAPLLLQDLRQSADGTQPGLDQRLDQRPEGLHLDPGSGASDGEPGGLRHGAPIGDGAEAREDAGTGRGSPSFERGEGRQPTGEPGPVDEGRARQPAEEAEADRVSTLRARRTPDGKGTCCGRCGSESLRPGVTLDVFAGSGTTLSVATGHGRDAIGIDIDQRNAELALERVGPLFLTVETLGGTEPFSPPAEDVITDAL